jgi:hypothetical protein
MQMCNYLRTRLLSNWQHRALASNHDNQHPLRVTDRIVEQDPKCVKLLELKIRKKFSAAQGSLTIIYILHVACILDQYLRWRLRNYTQFEKVIFSGIYTNSGRFCWMNERYIICSIVCNNSLLPFGTDNVIRPVIIRQPCFSHDLMR